MIVLAYIVFVIMLLLPFLYSYLYLKSTSCEPLRIQQDKVRDPRYFAKSMRKKLKENDQWKQGVLKLSREEPCIVSDNNEEFSNSVDKIIIGENDFVLPANVEIVEKEIVIKGNLEIPEGVKCRALMSEGTLTVGNNVTIKRWCDSENIVKVGSDCDLGISLSSAKKVSVEGGSSFRRIYAPVIEFSGGRYKEIGDFEKIMEEDIIKRKDVVVEKNTILKGSISTQSSVIIAENALVEGNIFADGDVEVRKGARVEGHIFTQNSIYVEKGCILGIPGEIRSIIAGKNIRIGESVVYGFVSCEDGGIIYN